MAKRVYFSFHYKDVIEFRANVVRNHWYFKLDREDAGYFDASLWESTKLQGSYAIKRLINTGLENTSVTCVLIGSETYRRPWVRYEILMSFKRGNAIFGIHINNIEGKDGSTKANGPNPLEYVGVTFSNDGKMATFWEKYDGKWIGYSEIDGSDSCQWNGLPKEFNGKGYNLSYFFPVYDWILDNGYNNFAKWVD